MVLTEKRVEAQIRTYLETKGWRMMNSPREKGAHGPDIRAWHRKLRKIYIIEAKGVSKKHPNQAPHTAFWSALGQILTRMDREGNHPKRGRRYGIGIPGPWERVWRNKIAKMEYVWKLLRLRVLLVDEEGNVEDKPYSDWL